MSDDRCAAIHPECGVQCERMAKHCNGPGIDHTAKLGSGIEIFWPNPHGSTPMHRYFQEWEAGKAKLYGLEVRANETIDPSYMR